MTEVATAPANGAAPASARERIAAELESEIAALLKRERHLELELAEIKTDRKSFEQSLSRLRGEPLIKHPGRVGRPPKDGPRSTSGLSDAIVEEVRLAILRFAEDHDEFSQVNIRTMPDSPTESSSKMAIAFERLRQDGVIRLARKDGNQKFFRLTSASLREGEREPLVGPERMGEVEQIVRAMLSEQDEINYAEVMERARISHSGASYAMSRLEDRGVVTSTRGGTGGKKLFRLNEAVDAS